MQSDSDALLAWARRAWRQAQGVNPFDGDCLPTRVGVFSGDLSRIPVPTPWNYQKPLRIFEAFYAGAEREEGWGRHNRYLDIGGLPPVLVTRDPGVIKAVQAVTGDKPGQFDRDTMPTAGIARATGEDSLLYANGDVWRRQKSLVAKPFSRSNLFQPQRFHGFEATFRQTVIKRLEILKEHQLKSGEEWTRIRLDPEIKTIMLEMLVNNFFGGAVSEEALRERFVPSLVYMIDHMVRDTVAPRLGAAWRALTGERHTVMQCARDFEVLTDIALSGRAEGRGLWEAFQSEASDDALRANIRVFLAGAMEATTSFASWAISHLSHHPEWQAKVFDEVREMDAFDPDDFSAAPHLNAVLEETLRLTPALYFLPRRATVDTWIETADGRRMMIPSGTQVRLDVWNANRCEDFWGTEVTGYHATEFAPQRWGGLEARGRSMKDMLHFGFGYGPRFCPGRSLGLLEVGLVVGAFVKLFEFRAVAPKTDASAGVSTKPADGATVSLKLRPPLRN